MNEEISTAQDTAELLVVQVRSLDHPAAQEHITVAHSTSGPISPRDDILGEDLIAERIATASLHDTSPPAELLDESPYDVVGDDAVTVNRMQQRHDEAGHGWHLRLMPDAFDRLHEHPIFELTAAQGDSDTPAEHMPAPRVCEADREPAYRLDLLRMFRQRLQLATMLGMLVLPIFAILHYYFASQTGLDAIAQQYKDTTRGQLIAGNSTAILGVHVFLFGLCYVVHRLAARTRSLLQVRMLTLIGYTLFSMVAALIVSQAGDSDSSQFLAYSGYHQLLLSILLMPFAVGECLVVATIIIGSLGWAAWMGTAENFYFYSWHLFALSMTAVFMLCVAYFQAVLRRQAFNSSFDLARSAAQLQALSVLDELTGGFNRRHLEKALAIEAARAARFERPLSVLMFDLDNFKFVNDTQGHAAGDQVLRNVWASATTIVREVDTVARYGGDEFTIVLPETDEQAAYTIAERLQSSTHLRLLDCFGAGSAESRVSISVGIVTIYPSEPVPPGIIIERADERLYEAKRKGKNCIVSGVFELQKAPAVPPHASAPLN